MSFIRPEARAVLWQWRGVVQGGVVALIGLWLFLTMFGFFSWIGLGLVSIGAVLIWTGALRARLGLGGDGPGVVEITERRVTYLAAEGGARFSLDDVTRIEVQTTTSGELFWIFNLLDGTALRIPAAAAEGEALFDALASFSGADYDAAIRAARSTGREQFLIWQKGD